MINCQSIITQKHTCNLGGGGFKGWSLLSSTSTSNETAFGTSPRTYSGIIKNGEQII